MDLTKQVILVTGANRGLGEKVAKELADRGAKVYAAARNKDSINYDKVIPIELDITNESSIKKAFLQMTDLTVLINNAGISKGSSFIDGDPSDLKQEFETNFFGTLAVTKEAVTIFEKNQTGFILNILSVLSWLSVKGMTTYSASKAAEWSLTNGLRVELAEKNIKVSGLHVAFMDTDLAKEVTSPKESPENVAKVIADGIEEEKLEIVVDETSIQVQKALANGLSHLYPQFN